MSKERQDAWSKENDLLLADTVLRHIREGGTQLKAFEEVGDRLNRTSAACGFRWNALVRNQYEQAIEIAKKQRKARRRMSSFKNDMQTPVMVTETDNEPVTHEATEQFTVPEKPTNIQYANMENQSLTLNSVINFLRGLEKKGLSSGNLEREKERLEGETQRLQKENNDLQKQLSHLQKEHETIKEDYQSVIQIMDRARKMVVLKDEEQDNTPSFKMDKNGNLEKVAK